MLYKCCKCYRDYDPGIEYVNEVDLLESLAYFLPIEDYCAECLYAIEDKIKVLLADFSPAGLDAALLAPPPGAVFDSPMPMEAKGATVESGNSDLPFVAETSESTCSICGNQLHPDNIGKWSICNECADAPVGFDPGSVFTGGSSYTTEVCSNCGNTVTILYGRNWLCKCGRINQRKGSTG
jgi:hypothetical protein